MGALRPHVLPAVFLEHLTHPLAGNRLHSSISCKRALAFAFLASATAAFEATSSQSSAASRMLVNASSMVSPSEWHPGRAGTLTEKPPTASGRINTLSFISVSFAAILGGRRTRGQG